MVWEPKLHIGASIVNAHGALSWNELATPDLDASADFYGELFGWKAEPFEGMPFPYRVIQNADGNSNGGMRPAQENEPTYWLVYFGTDDIDASLAKSTELGRHHPRGRDGHRHGQDRDLAGSTGSRVRPVRRRFRRMTLSQR